MATTKFSKLLLVMTPPEGQMNQNKRFGCYPPLGILQLATIVRKVAPHVEVLVRDQTFDEQRVAQTIDGFCDSKTLVGVSVLVTNYKSSVQLAERAKSYGSTVLFGNEQASVQPATVLTNRPFVDGVVVKDGRTFIRDLFLGAELSDLNNLFSRDGDRIIPPRKILMDRMEEWPIADRSLVDLTPYWANFRERFAENRRVANTNFAPGCGWGGCIYCSMEDLRPRHTSVDLALAEMRYLRETFGVTGIFETSDNLTTFLSENSRGRIDFLRQLAHSKPSDLDDLEFYVCGRSSDIKPESVEILKRLGVRRVSMGMDSGDQEMLDGLCKGETIDIHLKALELLHAHNIDAFISFVLGSPGETEESIAQTLRHVESLVATGAVRVLKASPLIPLKGSKSWKRMMKNDALRAKYEKDDCPDAIEVARDWAKHFCNVSYDCLLEAANKILGLTAQVKGMYLD